MWWLIVLAILVLFWLLYYFLERCPECHSLNTISTFEENNNDGVCYETHICNNCGKVQVRWSAFGLFGTVKPDNNPTSWE